MRILFILPDTNYVKEYMPDYNGSFHLGLGYLSSVLKKNGHDCSLIHIKNEKDCEGIGKTAKNFKPDLIAYTSFSHQFDIIRKVSKEIKKETGTLAVCGGTHATIDPEDVIQEPGIDIVCIGEGEDALLELVENLKKNKSIDKIGSLWIKKGKRIIKNNVRMLRQNLDELPFPDRELFDLNSLSDSKLGVLNVIATRGCPYKCTYCINHQLQKIYAGKGKYVRFRTVDNVIQEIIEAIPKYTYLRYIELLDDTFCMDKTWVKEFCEKYKKQVSMPFRVNTRINFLDKEVVTWLKTAGCERVAVGIESGNAKLREDILDRHMTNEEIIKVIRLCRQKGLEVTTYNMVGIPFENISNVLETVKVNAYANPNAMHVSIFQPYPNTKLYDICLENGFIKDKRIKTFFSGTVLKQNSISESEVNFSYKYFGIFARLYYLFGFFPLNKLLDKIFLNKRLHKFLLEIHPLAFVIVFPIKGVYRNLLKIFPNFMRLLKNKVLK